jgi:hypothetical protein
VYLSPRLQKRWVSAAAFGLVAWMLIFATHIHSPQDVAESPSKAHNCLVCSAFQPGAGAVAVAIIVAAQRPVWIQPLVLLPARFVRAFSLYRSRAPPFA